MSRATLLFIFGVMLQSSINAQSMDVKSAFLEKWDNSASYLMEIATAMPADQYNFKPTERQMSFEEQLRHIDSNIQWIGDTYFDVPRVPLKDNLDKPALIAALQETFVRLRKGVKATNMADLKTIKKFFAGPKSKLQLLNLLQDHVTHHRGQLIVYLNLCDVKAPAYSGW